MQGDEPVNKHKNLRPTLFAVLLAIFFISLILFAVAKFTERKNPPVSINNNDIVSKLDFWDDPDGTTAKTIVYEEDQSVYKSSFTGEYKAYSINPAVAKISKNGWNLLLLNKNYILPDDYEINLTEIAGSSIKLDSDAAVYYNKMYIDASREGILLTPFSGYRTVSFQRKLFENEIEDILSTSDKEENEAVNEATKTVNIPASSEHNAGLSVDIISREKSFSETEEYAWLSSNAHKYGFILRYPEGKEEITGVEFKPYHWRFVGVNAAKEMKKNGKCLEEYLSSSLKK